MEAMAHKKNRWFTVPINSMVDLSMANYVSHNQMVTQFIGV